MRFSVKTMVVLLTIAALSFAFWRMEVVRRNRAPLALSRIEKLGGLCDRENFPPSTIEFYGDAFVDSEFALLDFLPSTQRLFIVDSPATDDALKHLSGMKGLQRLHIQYGKFNGEGLKHLAGKSALVRIHLEAVPIEDLAIKHLQAIGSLRELVIKDCRISEEGIEQLKQLPGLTVLEVTGSYDKRIAREKSDLANL